LKDYHEIQAVLSSTRLNAEMQRGELDATCDALQVSKNEVSQARSESAILKEQAHMVMMVLVQLRTRVENLHLCTQATCNATFPMGTTFPVGTVDNLFAT
jgi:hypothetical protein